MPPRTRNRSRARAPKQVVSLTHPDAGRPNIATAELEPVMADADRQPVWLAYARRNRDPDLDPQLVWRGKDEQDASELLIAAPPLFIQEKIHPKALVDDLLRNSRQRRAAANAAGASAADANANAAGASAADADAAQQPTFDLFADFNGLHDPNARTDFYQHAVNWSNRLILGDSLQVMASLAEREGYRGQVQCIYIDPPYGIRFNSNFQWSTTSRDVRDGNTAHITREPEQVKAFRDTWRDGIHSYLSYLRDRLTVARDLLTDSGSVFVQIGDENVHRVRAVMDEVFGDKNFVSIIAFATSTGTTGKALPRATDYVLWYSTNIDNLKFRQLYGDQDETFKPAGVDAYGEYELSSMTSQHPSESRGGALVFRGESFYPSQGRQWSLDPANFSKLVVSDRVVKVSDRQIRWKKYKDERARGRLSNRWNDTQFTGFSNEKIYVVQSGTKVIQRCILMATDPGDLVLDPTCGAGTTAYVAEQWGRRWVTIDTSRVALALARARLMGARYPYYLLSDSPAGQRKEAEIARRAPADAPTYRNLRQGFVYQRVPHITLRDIANNAEIDAIYEAAEKTLAPLRQELSAVSGQWSAAAGAGALLSDGGAAASAGAAAGRAPLAEWELPRECPADWPAAAGELLAQYWQGRAARQRDIDASIAANANFEYLYDQPYVDQRKARVAGPFTVESLSPHRVISGDDGAGMAGDDGEVAVAEAGDGYRWTGEAPPERDFAALILDNLRRAGVQQAHRDDKIDFTSLTGWPGDYICAEGRFVEGGADADADDADADIVADDADIDGDGGDGDGDGRVRRAAIFIGPEFGTVVAADLTAAAREAGRAGFDLLIACAFSYDAHASELNRIGALPILKARMNADLHMAEDLKNTGQGNLFVIFGEPDVELQAAEADADGAPQWRVKINGVDIYHPATGQVRSDNADGIACWFVDTDYNEASFFVRHAYFLGASNDPYRALKTTLKAEIDAAAWDTLRSDTSRPFPKPQSGRIAVKVINHLGDEAMKILAVG